MLPPEILVRGVGPSGRVTEKVASFVPETEKVAGLILLSAVTTVDVEMAAPLAGVLTSGTETIFVGAVLHVAANQGTGTYEGEFSVTVNYE